MNSSAPSLLAYEWRCPICSAASTSLTVARRDEIEGQAVNDLKNHVRNTDGEGHGACGAYPSGFDLDSVADHLSFLPAGAIEGPLDHDGT